MYLLGYKLIKHSSPWIVIINMYCGYNINIRLSLYNIWIKSFPLEFPVSLKVTKPIANCVDVLLHIDQRSDAFEKDWSNQPRMRMLALGNKRYRSNGLKFRICVTCRSILFCILCKYTLTEPNLFNIPSTAVSSISCVIIFSIWHLSCKQKLSLRIKLTHIGSFWNRI